MSIMFKETKIIAGFPGTGKSYFQRFHKVQRRISDSDSSKFSWIEVDGEKKRNPDFPSNYIAHIKSLIGTMDIIFVSTHKEVRDALIQADIPFTIVYPDVSLKDTYLDRYRSRGNNASFISLLDSKFDDWVREIESEEYHQIPKIRLMRIDEYIDNFCISQAEPITKDFLESKNASYISFQIEKIFRTNVTNTKEGMKHVRHDEIEIAISIPVTNDQYTVKACATIDYENALNMTKSLPSLKIHLEDVLYKCDWKTDKGNGPSKEELDYWNKLGAYPSGVRVNFADRYILDQASKIYPSQADEFRDSIFKAINMVLGKYPDMWFINETYDKIYSFTDSIITSI